MKKMLFAVVLMGLVLASGGVNALVRPDVRITNYTLAPALEPGKTTQLTAWLENTGNDACAERISVQLSSQPPLSLVGPDTQFLDKLCQPEKTPLTFSVEASDDATLGNAPITATIAYQSDYAAQYATTQTISAKISGAPNLNAYLTGTNPSKVHPGETAQLSVTLENTGSDKASAVRAVLSGPAGIEIKPGASSAVWTELAAKKTATAEFEIFVPKTSAPQDYPLQLSLAYDDANENRQARALSLDLTVSPKALFEIQSPSDEYFASTEKNTAVFSIQNTGGAAAKNVRVKLIPSFPFSTDGTQRYIERLEPGKSSPAEFSIDVDKEGNVGRYALQMDVDYEDDSGQRFSDVVDVTLSVKPKDLGAYLREFWYVVAVALIAAAVFLRKKTAGKAKGAKA